jgi:pentatricopeptide repeat protein
MKPVAIMQSTAVPYRRVIAKLLTQAARRQQHLATAFSVSNFSNSKSESFRKFSSAKADVPPRASNRFPQKFSSREKYQRLLEAPLGSFTKEMWTDARRLIYDTSPPSKYSTAATPVTDTRRSILLLERALKENAVDSQPWLSDGKAFNKIIKQWRIYANERRYVLSPAEMARLLEEVTRRTPSFHYTQSTLSMILDVAARQENPVKAPAVAESILQLMIDESASKSHSMRPNRVIWNQVLGAWSSCGLPEAPERMEDLLGRMKGYGIEPDVVSYTLLIKYWSRSLSTEAPSEIEKVMKRMETLGLAPNLVTWNNLLRYWSHNGQKYAPLEANAVLERMEKQGIQPSGISWNHLLEGWASSDLPEAPEQIKKILLRMTKEGYPPTTLSYNVLIKAYANAGELSKAEALFEQMMRGYENGNTSIQPNDATCFLLLSAYSKSNMASAVTRAERFLDVLLKGSIPNIKVAVKHFNSAIMACLKQGETSRADRLLHRMADYGIPLNKSTFTVILMAWSRVKSPEAPRKAENIVTFMREQAKNGNRAVQPDSRAVNYVLHAWASSGVPEARTEMLRVFDQLESGEMGISPDWSSYATIVQCLLTFNTKEALERAETILLNVPSSVHIEGEGLYKLYVMVIESCLQRAECLRAENLFQRMTKAHETSTSRLNTKWYFYVIRALVKAGEPERASSAYERLQDLERMGLVRAIISPSTIKDTVVGGWQASTHPDRMRRLKELEER